MLAFYGEDLAYIHDVGHGDFAKRAAPALLAELRRARIHKGLVVDLGSGSGQWAEALGRAGYDVLGVDLSPALVARARRRAPRARFRVGSLLTAVLPPCVAVTSIGECLGYAAAASRRRSLAALFARVHGALAPGGLFVFDLLEPRRRPAVALRHRVGSDWAVLVCVEEDPRRRRLVRHIVGLRRLGGHCRRVEEVHRVRLVTRQEVVAELRRVGFRVRVVRGYGALRFRPGHVGFLARKPGGPGRRRG